MVEQSRPAGVTPTRKTPTWQLSSLPSRPLCCRATPAECDPFLVKADSSITPTVPTGEPAAEGTSSSAKSGLGLGHHVVVRPGGGADELLQARDVAVADQQGDRLDALALGADHQPLEVVVGVVLGLLLAEERGEPLVEVDQLFGRGAHVVRCHGGSLPT